MEGLAPLPFGGLGRWGKYLATKAGGQIESGYYLATRVYTIGKEGSSFNERGECCFETFYIWELDFRTQRTESGSGTGILHGIIEIAVCSTALHGKQ